MNRYIQVENHPDLIRDRETGAVLNINIENIRKQKKLLDQRRKEQQEIDQLKNDVGEIKNLLRQLLEKSKDG